MILFHEDRQFLYDALILRAGGYLTERRRAEVAAHEHRERHHFWRNGRPYP